MKTALVTGAGSGIGRAVAIALLSEGYRVALVGRRVEALNETSRLSQIEAAQILVAPGDVTKPDDVKRVFAQTVAAFGRLDLLFNNAGIGAPAVPIDEISLQDWQSVVNVNLTGVFLCTQAAFSIMKSQVPRGGRIINNGSISAQTPRPHAAPYVATKHAVLGLTKAAALDGRAFDIAVGQIDIGNTATDLLTNALGGGALQADGSRKSEPSFEVQHVARAVSYMASLPLHANVLSMTVMATGMPFVGRG
jgi:NAD(P)-dependent dehydrogenase (short-subunit alcohol dehydrogenase family)